MWVWLHLTEQKEGPENEVHDHILKWKSQAGGEVYAENVSQFLPRCLAYSRQGYNCEVLLVVAFLSPVAAEDPWIPSPRVHCSHYTLTHTYVRRVKSWLAQQYLWTCRVLSISLRFEHAWCVRVSARAPGAYWKTGIQYSSSWSVRIQTRDHHVCGTWTNNSVLSRHRLESCLAKAGHGTLVPRHIQKVANSCGYSPPCLQMFWREWRCCSFEATSTIRDTETGRLSWVVCDGFDDRQS